MVEQLVEQIKGLKEQIAFLQGSRIAAADISKVMKKKDNLTHTIKSDRSILSNQNREEPAPNQFLKPESFRILRLGSRQSNQTESLKNTQNNMDEVIKELEEENNIYSEKIKQLTQKKSNDELYIAEKEAEIFQKTKIV